MTVPPVLFWHAIIGGGEAVITTALISQLCRIQPAVLNSLAIPRVRCDERLCEIGYSCLDRFGALIPFAWTSPDGLEKVAEHLEIEEPEPVWTGLMPDHALLVVENPYVAALFSGFIGIFLVLFASWATGKTATQRE